MKIAVLSDVHGNWPALQAVVADIDQWQPDLVVVNGDVVNGGPSNDRCWRYIDAQREQAGWVVLRGNHEVYVAEWAGLPEPAGGPVYELSRLSHWTYQQLDGETDSMMALPERWEWTAPDGARLVAMHASLRGDRAGIYPHTADDDARRMADLTADMFVTAHTHIAHQRRLERTEILNIGAVGLTGDGDRRAAYGRLEWRRSAGWQASIRRVPYDTAAAERDFETSGFLDEAGPLALMTLVELRMARDAKTRWAAIYKQRVLAGEISVEAAVAEFLAAPEFAPFLPAGTGTVEYAAPRHIS